MTPQKQAAKFFEDSLSSFAGAAVVVERRDEHEELFDVLSAGFFVGTVRIGPRGELLSALTS